jgi:hypothetical protein
LTIKLPGAVKSSVNISPPELGGINWQFAPQASLVAGEEVVIPVWLYSIPASSVQAIGLVFQAPLSPGPFEISAELWQSPTNEFTQSGDFSFAAESAIFTSLTRIYAVLPVLHPEAPPVVDFATNLAPWLQANLSQIRRIPFCFLSAASVAGVLGVGLSDNDVGFLCDPLAPTVMPDPPFYGTYCGPGPDPTPPIGTAPPRDALDAACREHDVAYSSIQVIPPCGGIVDVLTRRCGPRQDAADFALCQASFNFDPGTSYINRIAGGLARDAMSQIFCGEGMPPSSPSSPPFDVSRSRTVSVGIVITSRDPNDKTGPQGTGGERFISSRTFTYGVFFENVPTATAAAQEVIVSDRLDVAVVDPDTFSLGIISFGGREIIPPGGSNQFTSDIDLRPERDLILRVAASFDPATGQVTWRFTSIDPETGQPTTDPTQGFLPPNISPPDGEAAVLFSVAPNAGLPFGTQIHNRATIVFDVNAPLATPDWLNTIDNSKPSSRVVPLSATQVLPSFLVQWQGTDIGAGIADYTVFVSENGGRFSTFLRNTTETSATFTGQSGKSYAFYSVARDQAGNMEEPHSGADTTTLILVDTTPPTITITFPAEGAQFALNELVAANYSCTDPSAVTACAGPVASGGSIDTSSVGGHTFTVTSTDTVGNTGSLNHSYVVTYNFTGFFSPIDNFPKVNSVKAGSAVPVKFRLGGNQGLGIIASDFPTSQTVPCNSTRQVDAVEETVAAGSSSLSYDAVSGQYVYVWKTDKSWAGTCRQLVVKLVDGTFHRANFKLVK